MTYEKFLKRAKAIHGDKYVYPVFDKISINSKIKIICNEHGEFEQLMYAHLNGQGCPKCMGLRRGYTTEDFVKEAKAKFGDKFDYSKSKYVNKRIKICIMSKDLITDDNPTGEFWQLPLHHLNSPTGMPFRGKRGRSYNIIKNTDIIQNKTKKFIEKAKKIYGDRYDYSKVEYKGAHIKICIICPEHGEFWQTPSNHLSGHGCGKCFSNITMTNKEFMDKANEIHNNKYDYSKVDIINSNKKICIICPTHGEFYQFYHHHLQGHGCPYCSKNKKLNNESFKEKATIVHGNKYTYDKVEYINNHTPVCITCPTHGDFLQVPASHLTGVGCPICNESHLESEINLLLENQGIKVIRGKKFDNIRFVNELPFDFYLPEYNTIIECQGMQHFEESPFFKDKYRFEKDKIKYNGCINNGIKILYYTNIKKYKKYFNEIYNENNLFINKEKLLEKIKKG